jgi:hypothetical protein
MNVLTKRWSHRRASRGVAMVEAGILAPIFAMMMMMTVYLAGTYETKYRTVMLSRYATWSFASNACSNSQFNPITSDLPPGITTQGGGTSNGQGGAVTQQQNANTSNDPYTNNGNTNSQGAAAQASLFMGHGEATLTWQYQPTLRFNNNQPKTITTQSQTVCNTPPPMGMNIFSYLGNILGSVF